MINKLENCCKCNTKKWQRIVKTIDMALFEVMLILRSK